MMPGLLGKVVVITGASSGLGEATARHLAAEGASVFLGARRIERLRAVAHAIEAAGGKVAFMKVDVALRAEVDAFVHTAVARFGRIDVLVNNAGFMALAPFEKAPVDEWERMIDINVKGVLYGIAAVLPVFNRQHSGHIVNVASIAGFKVISDAAVYCATKHAVRALSEGLRQEVDGIRTTIISPGVVDTELPFGISDPATAARWHEVYRQLGISPDAVARAVAYAIEQPADVDINEVVLRPTIEEL